MKPLSWDKQLGLASPRESAASQSDQTNHPSKNEVRTGGAGCKSPRPHLSEGRGESFFLDILFNRMSASIVFINNPSEREFMSGNIRGPHDSRPSRFLRTTSFWPLHC